MEHGTSWGDGGCEWRDRFESILMLSSIINLSVPILVLACKISFPGHIESQFPGQLTSQNIFAENM